MDFMKIRDKDEYVQSKSIKQMTTHKIVNVYVCASKRQIES
jgi:hypothetical protein